MDISEWKRLVAWLAVGLLLCSCGKQADEVGREALAGVEDALRIAQETPGIIGDDAGSQEAWSSALIVLEDARRTLSTCEGSSDACLATGLSQLLEADRQMLRVDQMNGVAVECRFGEIQSQTRQAATVLYVYFYGDSVSPERGDWRGPPTPRPPGVCPGG